MTFILLRYATEGGSKFVLVLTPTPSSYSTLSPPSNGGLGGI